MAGLMDYRDILVKKNSHACLFLGDALLYFGRPDRGSGHHGCRTTERFVRRFLDGMEYEAARTAPPEGFPRFPDTRRPLQRPRVPRSRTQGTVEAHLAVRVPHRRDSRPGSFMLWKKTGSPILIVRGKDRQDPRVLQHLSPSRRPARQDRNRTLRRPRLLVPRLDLRARRPADQPARQARLRRTSTLVRTRSSPCAASNLPTGSSSTRIWMRSRCSRTSGRSRSNCEQFQPETLRFIEKHGFDLKCNVKVLLDAFLEVYHLKSIHQSTVDRFLDHRGTSIALYRNGHSLMVTPNRRPDWVDPGTQGHAAHRDRHGHLGEEQSVVEFLPEPGRAVRPDRLPVPGVLADGRRLDADRMSLVRAGLGAMASCTNSGRRALRISTASSPRTCSSPSTSRNRSSRRVSGA